MDKIRYPGLLDLKDKLDFLISQIEQKPAIQIVQMDQNIIALSDGTVEYEYDCYEDLFEDWNMDFPNAR